MTYFIKRGDAVFGPLNATQIKSGIKNGQINFADVISKSKEGPWHPLADAIGKQQTQIESLEVDSRELKPLEMAAPPLEMATPPLEMATPPLEMATPPLETATPPLEVDTLHAGVSSGSWSQTPPPITKTPSTNKTRLVIGGLAGTIAILLVVIVALLFRTPSGTYNSNSEITTTKTGSSETNMPDNAVEKAAAEKAAAEKAAAEKAAAEKAAAEKAAAEKAAAEKAAAEKAAAEKAAAEKVAAEKAAADARIAPHERAAVDFMFGGAHLGMTINEFKALFPEADYSNTNFAVVNSLRSSTKAHIVICKFSDLKLSEFNIQYSMIDLGTNGLSNLLKQTLERFGGEALKPGESKPWVKIQKYENTGRTVITFDFPKVSREVVFAHSPKDPISQVSLRIIDTDVDATDLGF